MPLNLSEVLIMHDLDGYSRSEISKLLGVPQGTVANRLKKARFIVKREWS
jgi:DNA-directed RNA polymerase specialized sigma24 family protein